MVDILDREIPATPRLVITGIYIFYRPIINLGLPGGKPIL